MAYTTIKKPSDYFNTKLYTGNSTTLSVTGVGFQPDWTWIKDRNSAGDDHALYDAVRGTTKRIRSNQDDAENTQSDGLTSFDSDGFTVGTNGASNGDGQPFVAWNWLASNTTASNTDGSITSTVSANTTSGFSIVSWTGSGANATIGHGLGVAPKFLIVKNRSSVTYWGVQTSTGAGFEMNLNTTEAQTATSVYWNSTDPTSSVFSVGTNAATNNSGDNMIAYCFAPIQGFSKFGSYTGNGSADGTFVYTGFKPAFVIGKRTNAAEDWYLFDGTRDDTNPCNKLLYPGGSNAEYTLADRMDFLSNGFKQYNSDLKFNGSGDTYIYMAFAEEPLVGDNPATAR
jgi:hypothetical protein